MLQSKLSCGVSNVDEVYINEKAPFGYDYAMVIPMPRR